MKNAIRQLIVKLGNPILTEMERRLRRQTYPSPEAVAQKMLMQQYRLQASSDKSQLPKFADVGFRKHSQFEEDGILLFIFALIQPTNRVSVEICAGDGKECNTTNLILNHGWWGFLFDGNEQHVREGQRFFSERRDSFLHPPVFKHAWFTADNVNSVLRDAGVAGPVDLLSLDIDGMDYWVWQAIDAIDPRVVVCEVNNTIPDDLPLTVPYSADFAASMDDDFRGASLLAMTRLAQAKGYRLVGTHRFGFNAFFVKHGIGDDLLPEVSVSECLGDPYSVTARKARWPKVEKCSWQVV